MPFNDGLAEFAAVGFDFVHIDVFQEPPGRYSFALNVAGELESLDVVSDLHDSQLKAKDDPPRFFELSMGHAWDSFPAS